MGPCAARAAEVGQAGSLGLGQGSAQIKTWGTDCMGGGKQAHQNGVSRSRVLVPWQSQKLKVLHATLASSNGSNRDGYRPIEQSLGQGHVQ